MRLRGVVRSIDAMRVLRALTTIVLAVGFAGATGCDTSDSRSLEDTLLTRAADDSGDSPDAQIQGTLELDAERGCILLSGMPVIWPAGTTASTEPPELHLPDGSRIRHGEVVTGGGGEIPAASVQQTRLRIEGDLDAAIACAVSDDVLLIGQVVVGSP